MGKSVLSYFNPSDPGSFSGLSTYQRHHSPVDLSGYRTYTLHKPVRRRFKRNKIIVAGIDALWEIDLSDMSKFKNENDNYRFIFCVIDVFSKYAWAIPMKSKSATDNLKTLQILFERTDRRPVSIRSDKGSEFRNKLVQDFLIKNKIKFYTSQNEDVKCGVIERHQKSLKGRLWRYFTYTRKHRYIDVLDQIVDSMNHTYHRTIGMAPNKVSKANEAQIWSRMYGGKMLFNQNFRFKVGDQVRISTSKMIFKKSYEGLWSEEIFLVNERLPRNPPVYRLIDLNNVPIQGTFYGKELQKVKMDDNVFIVEKVVKTRTRNSKREYLVKWLGYPDSFNSWVDELME